MSPKYIYENMDDDDINKHLPFLPNEDLKLIFSEKIGIKDATSEAVKDGVIKYNG